MREICQTLGFNKTPFYYQPKSDPSEDLLRAEIQKLAARYPTYGYRRIRALLLRQGYTLGYKRVARLMKEENFSVSVKCVCQTTRSSEAAQAWVNRLETLEVCVPDRSGRYYLRPPERTLPLCRPAHGCLHSQD